MIPSDEYTRGWQDCLGMHVAAPSEKEISDEQIVHTAAMCFGMHYMNVSEYTWIKFARALLAASMGGEPK
jgi:alkylhydroperoxidase/carboxymuconolactone decarboxylase family protein YurZ